MFDIFWLAICLATGVPMILNPDKVAQRPKCRIKSLKLIRGFGIFVVILGIIPLFIRV